MVTEPSAFGDRGGNTLEVNIWDQVKKQLKDKNPDNPSLSSWLDPVKLISSVETDRVRRFTLSVPHEFHRRWVVNNFMDTICSEVASIYDGAFQIDVSVAENADKPGSYSSSAKEGVDSATYSANATLLSGSALRRDYLNSEYSFSTFVVGRMNEFAHAACYRVAENPGGGYNPLFICGPTGMGKTHLLHAVGNYIQTSFPQLSIRYVSAEKFLNECISGIRRGQMDQFRLKFREQCDVLLMDDIQVLGKGDAVQEEFFYTLNSFFETGRQVVVASDRMPKDIQGLEDRIRTRLEWGLIADIQMADMETRVAILRYKSEMKGIQIPEDVIHYIARISKRSIRELEGNLNKVKMFTELQGLPITIEVAKQILAGHDGDSTPLTMDEILRISAEHFKIRINDLKSTNRAKPIVTARQVAMYLAKKYLNKSLMDIGRAFGGKDHSTVINAIKRIDSQQIKDTELRRDLEELQTKIDNITGV